MGYLSLDLSAPEGRQLTASGALAYFYCYSEDDCEWTNEGSPETYYEEIIYEGPLDEGELPLDDPWGEPLYWEDPEIWEDPAGYYEWGTVVEEGGYYELEVVDDGYGTVRATVVQDPWYVQAFPGIGRMVQQIIPGAQQAQTSYTVQPSYAPAPPPTPQRVVYPQPSCWISAQPMTVPYGGSSVLQWNAFNASRVSFSDTGAVPAQGLHTVSSITSDRTFTLSVLGQGGSGSCYTRVSVDRSNSSMPSCVISAHPSSISRGQNASLAWVSSNAQSASLSGHGAVSLTGGTFISPQTSTTYTLTVRDSQGRSGTCTTQIGVLP